MKNVLATSARQTLLAFSAVAFAFVLLAVATPAAHAQFGDEGFLDGGFGGGDFGGWGGGFDGGFTGGDWGASGFGDTGYCDYGCGGGFTGGDWGASGFGDTGYCSGCESGFDYNPYSGYNSGFGSTPFGGSSFGGGSGFNMPFSMPSSGGNFQTQNQNQAQSQSQSSNNTNVNNNVNNVNVTVPQAQPTIVYQQQPVYQYQQPTPTYDICPNLPGIQSTLPAGYFIQNGNCQYQNYTAPVYPTPAPQPYVTLSQVPYTGLELGPVGTALYWGFLVLWCLIAAYLIAVKKVQNKLAAWLVGSFSTTVSHAPRAAHVAHAPAPKAVIASATSGIDPFIQAQINRASK